MHYCWSSCITRSLVHVGRLREALHSDEVLFFGAEQMGPNDLLSREYSSYCPQLNETPPKTRSLFDKDGGHEVGRQWNVPVDKYLEETSMGIPANTQQRWVQLRASSTEGRAVQNISSLSSLRSDYVLPLAGMRAWLSSACVTYALKCLPTR